ncbi:MAG: shikimate kinase [Candidatus Magnetominusculus sp. LBB02]|nr:shikimate kinase [Candidatus Magnetominusculus sp. LBB02]
MNGIKLKKSLFLVGPSGSGKTAVGGALSRRLRLPFIDTDAIIEHRENKPIYQIFDQDGEARFRALEKAIIIELFKKSHIGIVATGGGLPTIDGLMGGLLSNGTTVYLKATIDELWTRLSVIPEELEKRPLLHKKGRVGLEGMMRSRESIYMMAEHIVNTDGLNVDQTVERIHQILKRN